MPFAKRMMVFLLLLLSVAPLTAQYDGIEFKDRIYVDYIRSVKFHLDGLFLSYPIVDLNSPTPLFLEFDDIDGGVKTFTYRIIHCDAQWEPSSNINEMDFQEGFSEMPINDYRFSYKVVTNFTHYELRLPNQDLRWKISGNYLLVIYEDEGDKFPVITRRFMVVDPMVRINPEFVRPAQVSKNRTHHEIDFVVDHQGLDIRSPMMEIKATVLQNGRWDNAITGLQPAFMRPGSLIFDHQDKVVFPAGKEFRFVDIRSLQRRGETVSAIERYRDRNEVILYREGKRFSQAYSFIEDINGNFVIESYDDPNGDLAGDYAYVLFTLASEGPMDGYDVYIFGALSGWELRPEFQMIFNESINSYVCKPLLKQGFYNYMYAAVPQNDPTAVPDFGPVEGNWWQTENEYIILIYYRPFGSRFDQLIGARTFGGTPR